VLFGFTGVLPPRASAAFKSSVALRLAPRSKSATAVTLLHHTRPALCMARDLRFPKGMLEYRPMRSPLCVTLALILTTIVATRAEDWQISRLEGRDYLSLDQIAAFYGFPTDPPPETQLSPENKRVSLDSGKAEVELVLNGREAVINGVKHWLAFPVRMDGDKLLVSRLDLAETLEPALRPQLIQNLPPVRTVVLDAGHGGHDKGAVNVFGSEKDFALDVVLRAKRQLEAEGVKVVLTRSADVFVPLEERAKIANRIPNSIFVSVHFNCAEHNHDASGFEIFSVTPRGAPSTADENLHARDLRAEPGNLVDIPSVALSGSVYHAVLGHLPQNDRGVKRARFAVLRLATVPAILIEGGFVTNADDSRLIASADWREKYAGAIVSGIENYKYLAEHRIPPRLVADYRRLNPGGANVRDLPTVTVTVPPPAVVPAAN
jgi:N-acetylmuramoyl-L-alanine amidase